MQSLDSGVIGRYVIDRKIGSGGMACAYRCRLDGPSGFQKSVLVKILRPDWVDDVSHLRMFMAEARLCARLDHPQIPAVFELGEQDGLPFMVMEYVDGPTLVSVHRKLRDGAPRHFGHIAHIFQRVARALHHAHCLQDAHGRPLHIVHRDVSLANILVGWNGHAKLIDFGIASWAHDSEDLSTDVPLKGKLRYMAPEQLVKDAKIDSRVDVYQLGVTLYWLSCGKPPFSPGAVMASGPRAPKWPTERLRDYPEALERIVIRCLATDPADRFQSAGELADALEAFTTRFPQYASSDEGVASWIQSLFAPREDAVVQRLDADADADADAETESSGMRLLHSPFLGHTTEGYTGTRDITENSTLSPRVPPPRDASIGRVGWLGLLCVAVVSAVMGAQLVDTLNISRAQSAFALRVEQDPDGAADALLEDVETLLASREVAAARVLMRRVAGIQGVGPEVLTRLARAEVRIDRESRLAVAKRALIAHDHAAAEQAAGAVLDMLPEDADAIRILEQVARARLGSDRP